MAMKRKKYKIKIDNQVFSITSNSLRKAVIKSILKYFRNAKSIPNDMELRIQINSGEKTNLNYFFFSYLI
jgi:hypothetical protein